MKSIYRLALSILVLFVFFCAGCSAETLTPTAVPAGEKLVIYAPASTSSIPVILAASRMENVELTLYTNQAQANTLFLRGDVPVLVTGLSVGVDLVRNGAPIQMVNSFVSGLSYLVTYGQTIHSFADLKGQQIYLPFEGSPLEETTAYFTRQAGLTWKKDVTPVYASFESSIELLKQGKAALVVVPEPNVTLLEGQPNLQISLSYYDEWNKSIPGAEGYPQVGTLVNAKWAASHGEQVARFNQELADAIVSVQQNPAQAVETVKARYKLPAEKLLKSLNRTHYRFTAGKEMKEIVTDYYTTIGKPLDEKFTDFYYIPVQ